MKTQNGNQKLLSSTLAIVVCALITCGCDSRKAPAPVESQPKEGQPQKEPESPAVENAPAKLESTEKEDASATEPTEPTAETTEPSVLPTELAAPVTPPATWSTQRIIALSATGPLVIDVSANIGGKSLDEAAEAATQRATAKITKDMAKPWKWPDLLDHPLVGSGWLGNLVPEADQRDQLVKMYNTDGDEEVDDTELLAFLTRGLARGAAFRFTDIGSARGGSMGPSPWEHLDANRDSTLDSSEIGNLQNVVRRFDLNADGIVTIAEIQAGRSDASSESMGMTSMLDTKSGFAVSADSKPQQTARKILEHYTALASITRDQWMGWNDKQWSRFDLDGDNEITRGELEPIATAAPDVEVRIQFLVEGEPSDLLTANVSGNCDLQWSSRLKTSGQVSGHSMALGVNVIDNYTASGKASLRMQLAAALTNPQLETFLRTQLQLKEGAFDILDADKDDKLSDEEFESAWDWITAIRGSRLLARWMFAESAWYRMADVDADGRLTEVEVQKFPAFLSRLDRDKDGVISPIEMPLAVRLELVRTDDRLGLGPNSQMQPENSTVERNWFAASDSNNDGSVSSTEFLGSREDFSAYDTDNDGFITATEAYKNPPARVQ